MSDTYETLYSAKLGCYKLKENAKLPTKGSGQAACYDLYSCSDEPILLEPQGIIDSDYVEEVFVPMVNNTEKYFHIHPGDRIAQLELVREIVTDVYETEERPEQKTDRDGGFGSTGVN
jgi:dUTPase